MRTPCIVMEDAARLSAERETPETPEGILRTILEEVRGLRADIAKIAADAARAGDILKRVTADGEAAVQLAPRDAQHEQ